MLTLTVPGIESWDEKREEFVTVGDTVLHLEHSLVSLSKWEEKYEKPFLSQKEHTPEESLGYVECMIVDPIYPEDVWTRLSQDNMDAIADYMNSKKSATWFAEDVNQKSSKEVITSELIYFWMTAFRIPFEPAQNWHLNRLFNLIRVASLKNSPPKKMSPREIHERNRRLNEQRRRELGTSG